MSRKLAKSEGRTQETARREGTLDQFSGSVTSKADRMAETARAIAADANDKVDDFHDRHEHRDRRT
ncbi:MAG: hypothetical protein JWM86_428 [Thermoleophilia bacterium]|nr:hypothetical protein [Thermoleophilia bacterium]